jgi:hypothetical protein
MFARVNEKKLKGLRYDLIRLIRPAYIRSQWFVSQASLRLNSRPITRLHHQSQREEKREKREI